MDIPEQFVRTKADIQAIQDGCTWDQRQADGIITFAHQVFKPQYISGQFTLLDWQRNFLMSLYGWRDREGNRRFKYANLHCPKKVGKTLICSLICAYELVSGEQSPVVMSGSVSKENAGQIFLEIKNTLEKAGLKKWCKFTPNQRRLVIPSLNAEYRSLASDGDRCQGYNCSLVVIDEAAWHKNSSLYDSLKYAHIARPNGLCLIISTASDDVTGYYHGIYLKSKRVLAGEDLDTTHYAAVYESEPDKDANDPVEWAKANPSLGTSFTAERFRLDLEAAKADPTEWLRFLRYRLNRWTRADEVAYFDVTTWDKYHTAEPANLHELPAFFGVDLSMTTDPSAVTAVFDLGGGRYYVKSWAWCAREGVEQRERTSLPRYQDFEAGSEAFKITDGSMIDHDLILNFLIESADKYRIQSVAFDPTSALVCMARFNDATGVDVFRIPQTYRYFNGPMKLLRQSVQAGRFSHDGNNWLRYCLQSVRVEENTAGEIRPSTKNSTDHIDGAVALMLAFHMLLSSAETTVRTGMISI